MILLTGGKGMLARALAQALPGPLTSVDIEECDLTRETEVRRMVEAIHPGVIINTAAFTDVDGCEEHPGMANAVNGEAVGHLARAAESTACRLIHISTDYVFDGRSELPYREEDLPNPISLYGKSKLLGEERARQCGNHIILRISWLFGPGKEHFISRMAGWIQQERDLTVIDDQVNRITYTRDVAKAVTLLLESDFKGTLHFANNGESSRLEQVFWMKEILGKPNLTVKGVSTEHFSLPAARPMHSSLNTARFEALTGWKPPHWQDALRRYFQEEGWG